MITEKLYNIGQKLFPVNRSITGHGTVKTLRVLKSIVPKLKIKKIKSGKKIFDWLVPPEWNVNDAFVEDKFGDKIIDIKNNNLHLVGYSSPAKLLMDKSNLLKKLNSDEQETLIKLTEKMITE